MINILFLVALAANVRQQTFAVTVPTTHVEFETFCCGPQDAVDVPIDIPSFNTNLGTLIDVQVHQRFVNETWGMEAENLNTVYFTSNIWWTEAFEMNICYRVPDLNATQSATEYTVGTHVGDFGSGDTHGPLAPFDGTIDWAGTSGLLQQVMYPYQDVLNTHETRHRQLLWWSSNGTRRIYFSPRRYESNVNGLSGHVWAFHQSCDFDPILTVTYTYAVAN